MKKLSLAVILVALVAGSFFLLPPRPAQGEGSPLATLKDWVTQARVESPTVFRNLAIYPVVLEEGKLPAFRSLDQALKQGGLQVTEVNQGGSVNTLVVENTGSTAVFIMAGEILSGAKQDRVTQHDLWLAPHSGKVDVGAYCVEHGRWSSGPSRFESKGSLANIGVRQTARAAKSQAAVWDRVAETQERAGYAAPTQSLNAAYEDKRVVENVDAYFQRLSDLPAQHPKMMGVIVQIGSNLVAADCFGERQLLIDIWPKLLKSYALEAHSRDSQAPAIHTELARNFLQQIAQADPTRQANPGQGVLLDLTSANIAGSALVLDSSVVHLEAFPQTGTPRPLHSDPVVRPIQRQYPR